MKLLQGFYEIYANAFKTIFEEEVEFLEQTEDMERAPEFGNSQSSFEEVPTFSYIFIIYISYTAC